MYDTGDIDCGGFYLLYVQHGEEKEIRKYLWNGHLIVHISIAAAGKGYIQLKQLFCWKINLLDYIKQIEQLMYLR